MTVADFINRLEFGTQMVRIRNRQKFCYFEGTVADIIRSSPVKLRKVKDLPVLGISTTVSNGKVWVIITTTD